MKMISASFVNWLRRSSAVLAFSLLTLCALPAHAFAVYTVPGSTAVGAKAATVAVPVTFTSSGTLSTISVVTGGIAKLDFTTDGSGSCSTNSSYMAGQSCTVGVIFAPTAPGMRTGAILLMNSDGNVLATELLGANALGSVGVMVPGIINTLAGNGGWIFDGDNGPATGAQLFLPSGIAVDAAGNTYISDSGNNRVRRVDALTGIITTVAGNGNPGFSGDNGLATVATLNNPVGLALDGAGNLYIADSGNNAIRMVYATTHFITTVAGEGGIQGSSGNNGPATSALLNNPNSIAFDPAGNLYIADTGNSVIRKVTPGGTISIFAGNGTFSFSGDNGPANTAALNYPWGVAASPTGYVYIADLYNNRIRQVSPSGIITTFAGNGNSGYQGDSGLATLARLTTPADVAVDAGGNIYIADSGNNVIRKVNALTGIITTIAGEANAQINGDGGQATNADIYGPYAVVLDSADNLYIADMFHNRIRAVSSSQDLIGYPAMRVDRLSLPFLQTFENDGNAALSFSALNLVSNSSLDPATTTCGLSFALPPSTSCVLGAVFAPTVTGTHVTGSISLASNAANAPGVISLYGQVETLDPTVASLTSSANPAAIGAPVTFTATISLTSGGAAPTGTVNFMDGTNLIGTGTLNGSSIAMLTTSSLALGLHSITAVYPGDANSSPSTSSPLSLSVKQTSSTSLAANPTTLVAGATLTLTATLTASNAVPTGNVVFQDGSTAIGNATINAGGVAIFTITSLAPGQHTLTAVYNGDTGTIASASSPVTVSVQAVTTTTLSSSSNPSSSGATVIFTATVTPTGSNGTLSGNVTFTDSATTLGTGTLNGSGVATLNLSNLALGNHSITATYSGNSGYAGSASAALPQVVQLATTSTLLSSSANPSIANASVTFTATVTGNGALPTGNVVFKDGTTTLGQGTLNAAGHATYVTSSLSVATHSIVASYAGDSNNSASSSTPLSQIVQTATAAVALSSTPNPSSQNISVQFTATVTSNGTTPTGSVAFMEGTNTLGSGTLNSKGVATWSTSTLSMGQHTIIAVYSGDAYNSVATSAALLQNVLPATNVALTSSVNPGTAGAAVTFTATVTGNGGTPTGTVAFTDGTTNLGSSHLNGSGIATLTTSALNAGAHSIVATYAGDTNNASSTSSALAETMQQATTSAALTPSSSSITRGASLQLSVSVTGNGATPTGSVTFMDGTQTLGTQPLTGGSASLTTSALTVGSHNLTTVYSGDTNDATSTSPTIVVSVIQASPALQIAPSVNPSLAGTTITLTATIVGGAAGPGGTINWFDGTTAIGSSSVNGSGVSTFLVTLTTVGAHSITAAYSGDVNNNAATSSVLTQNVQQSTTSAVQSGSAQAVAGKLVTFTATVTGNSGTTPTGSVIFKDGSATLATVALSNGSASFNDSSLTTGTHSITVTYAGDSSSQASVSAPWIQTIIAATTGVALTSSANPSVSGAAITLTATVTGNGTVATGSVTFYDGSTIIGTGTLSNGTTSFTTSSLAAGQHALTAQYAGDSNNESATSAVLTQTVQVRSTTTLASSGGSLLTLQPVTLTATVVNTSTTVPTGNIIFSDGATLLGTSVLNAQGIATLTVPSLGVGSHNISAAYGGDTLDLSSTSASVVETVQLRATSASLAASATSLNAGQQLTLFAAVQSTGPVSATGMVSFYSGSNLIGSTPLTGSGIATLTYSPTAGSYNITANYSGDSVYAQSSASAIGPIVVGGATQVTIALNPSSVSVVSQQYSIINVTLTAATNFTDTMQMGCAGLPTAATCTFSSDQVALSAAGTKTVQLTLDTGSPLTDGGQAKLEQHRATSTTMACALPAAILLGFLIFGARRNRRSIGGLLLLILAVGTISLTGCGTSVQMNGTPAGTYNVVVTAIGAKTGAMQSSTVVLTVTQ